MNTNQTSTTQRPAKIRRIYCSGPKLEQNRKGEEIPIWRTFLGDSVGALDLN